MRKYMTIAFWQVIVLTTAAYALLVFTSPVMPKYDDVMDSRPHATGSPVEMMDRYDCWKGASPKDMIGKIPGHVIIRFENKGTVVYAGTQGVSKAFAQIFDDAPTDHTIYGFCR